METFLIFLKILKHQLHHLSIADQPQILSRFTEVFKQMWIQNGDQVSKMYAGTGALEGRSKVCLFFFLYVFLLKYESFVFNFIILLF